MGGGRNLIVYRKLLLPLLLKVGARFFPSEKIHTLHRCGNQGDTIEDT